MELTTVQQQKRTMTISEVANVFGVSVDLVAKRVKELYPDAMKQGVTTYLTEEQVTAVRLRITENSHLATSDDRRKLVDMPKTDLEKELLIAQAMQFQREKIQALQQQLAIAAPKIEFYDAVTGSSDTIDIGEAAKVLAIPGLGRNNLFAKLREKGVLMHNNQPYQKHIDAGHFRQVESKYLKPDGTTCINIKTVVYQKGLEYIRKIVQ